MATTHLSAASAFSVDLRIIGTGDAKQSTKAAVVKKNRRRRRLFYILFFPRGEREREGGQSRRRCIYMYVVVLRCSCRGEVGGDMVKRSKVVHSAAEERERENRKKTTPIEYGL
jgi:hypothetical protein